MPTFKVHMSGGIMYSHNFSKAKENVSLSNNSRRQDILEEKDQFFRDDCYSLQNF